MANQTKDINGAPQPIDGENMSIDYLLEGTGEALRQALVTHEHGDIGAMIIGVVIGDQIHGWTAGDFRRQADIINGLSQQHKVRYHKMELRKLGVDIAD